MGVRDETTYRFSCKCGALESVRSVEHGSSSYGGGLWTRPTSALFEVKWGEDGYNGPTIESLVCRACGAPADHSP